MGIARAMSFAGLLVLGAAPAWAQSASVGIGVEYAAWQEIGVSGSQAADESGLRYFVHFNSEIEVSDQWIYGFKGRLYSGRSDFDGDILSADGLSSVDTETDYGGVAAELGFIHPFRAPRVGSMGDFTGLYLAVGYEYWRRNILDSSAGPGYGQRYEVGYGRLAFIHRAPQRWSGEAGVKVPVLVDQRLELTDAGFDDDVTLRTQGDFSFYGEIEYHLSKMWTLAGHYDSYRFKKSDKETVAAGGVLRQVSQAESHQDSVGVRVSYHF